MIIIQAMNEILTRHLAQQLTAHLRTMPAVVLTGARQTGKSTLAQTGVPSRRFVSLDDFDVLDAAREQPESLLGGTSPLTRSMETKRGRGLLLHTGDTVEWLTPDVLAVPWWRVI